MIALECRAIVELVSGYLDQTLDARSHGRFVAHLAGCEGCERYVDQVQHTIRLVFTCHRGADDYHQA